VTERWSPAPGEAVDTTETQHEDAPAASRWFQRVLPLSAVVVALIALAALVSPAFRDEVRLSTSRQAQPFVALYFARTTDGAQLVCSRKGRSVRVLFDVASHLEKQRPLAYQVSVASTAKGAKAQRKAGSVQPAPGAISRVQQGFVVPRHEGYTVSVRLPALDQQLRAHCSGRRS
jgi:hypothetical protein